MKKTASSVNFFVRESRSMYLTGDATVLKNMKRRFNFMIVSVKMDNMWIKISATFYLSNGHFIISPVTKST